MNHHVDHTNEIQILRIREERLDSNVAPELKAFLLEEFDKNRPQRILLDLKKVDYADSSGLGAILFGLRLAREDESQVKLMHVNPRVMTLLKIAKLETIIDTFDDEAEAVASFA